MNFNLIIILVGIIISSVGSAKRRQRISLLPYPNSPFYGVSFNQKTTWNNLLPLTVSGKCEENKTYAIKTIEDFNNHLSELECIFTGARIPTKIPTGGLYATCLTAVNAQIFNPIIEYFWKGKFVREMECNGSQTFVGWNAFYLGPSMPFILEIRKPKLNLAIGEHYDGRGGIVVEYKNDVMKLCPELKDELLQKLGPGGVSGSNVWSKNIPFIDVIRLVGKQDDGGNIYLLKTFLRDAFREDKMATTSAFTAMLNYDSDANPTIFPGIETEPLAENFTYMFPGFIDMLIRGLPLDNLPYTPLETLGQLYREAVATKRTSFAFLKDLPSSYRKIINNSRNWLRMYNSGRTQNISPISDETGTKGNALQIEK